MPRTKSFMGLKSWYNKTFNSASTEKALQLPTSTGSLLPTSIALVTGTPVWRNLAELSYLLDCYEENPVVNTLINLKADYTANAKYFVKDLKTDELTPLAKYEDDKGKLHDLISQPNPLQNTSEWVKQLVVNHEVFGNAYLYSFVPVGWEAKFTYQDIITMTNLPSYGVTPVLTGKWLNVETKEDIISSYNLQILNGKKRELHTNTVMHTNEVNLRIDQDFTTGKSKLLSQKKPISNIDLAYKSRNILIENRGAQGIISSEARDEMGAVPLGADAKKEILEDHKKDYGISKGQFPFIISTQPLKYQKTERSTKELMLFEEVATGSFAIAKSYGIPHELAKYHLSDSTYKNIDASERKFYDSTIIPETETRMKSINNFFNTKEFGIELVASFDHINVLQENKKQKASTENLKEKTAKSQFSIGAITYNGYLTAVNLPLDDEIGSLRVWDLDSEQLTAIGINNSNKQADEGGND